MKNLKYFLLILSVMALVAADLHAQTPRLFGARRFVLDNNDLITANNVYFVDNAGSMGIDAPKQTRDQQTAHQCNRQPMNDPTHLEAAVGKPHSRRRIRTHG